jgi:hypothetical protein
MKTQTHHHSHLKPRGDPVAVFRAVAEAAGVIGPGDPLDRELIAFAYAIVERCASAAEPFGDHDFNGAEAIRAELGDH